MCDGVKDYEQLRKQYDNAVNEGIDIIEVEFSSGNLKYRDRWSVRKILDNYELSKLGEEREQFKTNNPLKGRYNEQS